MINGCLRKIICVHGILVLWACLICVSYRNNLRCHARARSMVISALICMFITWCECVWTLLWLWMSSLLHVSYEDRIRAWHVGSLNMVHTCPIQEHSKMPCPWEINGYYCIDMHVYYMMWMCLDTSLVMNEPSVTYVLF